MSFNYNNLDTPTKSYLCHEKLEATQLDSSLYNPLLNVIEKLNSIGNYIRNNEDSWNSEGSSEGGDTLEFPLSAINGLQTSSTNKILYYNNDGNWEYKDYKELQYPLSELYNLPADLSLDLSGTKYVLVYDLETPNGRGWKFLRYNTGTGSGLTPGKVAYDLNTVNNPNTNVKQILVWDSDGNNNWGWRIENYTSTSPTTGLTWTDLINSGSNKINVSHLPSILWWGNSITSIDNANKVLGNLEGNIEYIKFEVGTGSNYKSVYLGIDSDGNLRVSKSATGNDGATGANFYATGGVSALGNSSSSGGGDVTPGETSLKALLNNVNDLGTNYANPSAGYTIVYDNGNWIDRKLDLSELGNISIDGLESGDVLMYDSGRWINSSAQFISSLGLLSDVDDTVSNIKALNVIQPSGSILSYSYPLTLLVGSTSDTSSDIYNSEVTWKLYVFLLETDSTAAHLIDGESLTSNMGIVTRLNFGQAGSPMNNYRFPTYITGVRLQGSNDGIPYYLTGSKHFKKQNPSTNDWQLDYDETFCSLSVYIQNGELYSGGNHKVLTTNNLNGTFSDKNYAVNINNGKLYVSVPWTDENVKQTYTSGSDSNSYDLLFAYTPYANYTIDGNADTVIEGVRRSFNIRYTPSTQTLIVNNLEGKATQIATAYKDDGWLQITGVINATGSGRTELKYSNLNMKNRDILFPDGGNILYGTTGSNVSVFRYYNSSSDGNHLQIGQGASNFVTEIYGSKGVSLPDAYLASSGLRIGDAILYWDADNQALALTKVSTTEHPGTVGNFYATGGVSALGFSNGTSSVDTMTFNNLTVDGTLTISDEYVSHNISINQDDLFIDCGADHDIVLNSNVYANRDFHLSYTKYLYLSSKWRLGVTDNTQATCVLEHNDSNSSTPNWQAKGTWSVS